MTDSKKKESEQKDLGHLSALSESAREDADEMRAFAEWMNGGYLKDPKYAELMKEKEKKTQDGR